MAYKEDYYEQVDKLFDTIKTNPFVSGDGGNAVSQEDQGQIQPAGWVENANATDGTATVTIDADGVTIEDGALTVVNPGGTVIIDGSSNMFKIAATGTLSVTGPNGSGAGGGTANNSATISTGLTAAPVSVWHLQDTTGFPGYAMALPYVTFDNSNGFPSSGLVTDRYLGGAKVVNTNETQVTATWSSRLNRSASSLTWRYYLMKETAF